MSKFKEYLKMINENEELGTNDIKKDKKKLNYNLIKSDFGGFLNEFLKTPNAISNPTSLFSIRQISTNKIKLDFDVYLPSISKNLQREKVWNLKQKQELIRSLLHDKYVPETLVIFNEDNNIYEVIDGKQRITTIIDFCNNEFPVIIGDEEYYFNDFDSILSSSFLGKFINGRIIMNPWKLDELKKNKDTYLTDQNKIDLFKFANFTGTPQDEEHLKNLGIK